MKGMVTMKFDINTLAFIESLIFVTQVIVLLLQYRVNRTYRGVGWAVLGSVSMATGVIFMPLVYVKSLLLLAMIANPLVVLGQIFLYIGITRFLDKKENKWTLLLIFAVSIFFYYYYIFVNNSISARTIIISVTLATLSIMTAYRLFFNKNRLISVSTNFTAAVFLIYGVFQIARVFYASMSPPMQNYSDERTLIAVGFIFPVIVSTLWTFGFIIMLNHRLNIENRLEKEKMQLIFNTSPDAALITRLSDGFIIDVNHGFSVMTGYSHQEAIGNSTLKTKFWDNPEERKTFLDELDKKGICENMEFVFRRKDGSKFLGAISAKIITIFDVPHIINSVHDITKRKHTEEALRESEEMYRSILNASPDDITITDMQGNIIMVSQASKEMFGYDFNYEDFIGMSIVDFVAPEDIERVKANVAQLHRGGSSKTNEYHAVRKDKSTFDIEVNSGIINNSNGQPTKMVFIIREITKRKLAEQKIQELVNQLEIERNIAQKNSITDSLTGLANRRYFDEALKTEYYRIKRTGGSMSLLMLDIDYFKKYNDTYGHLAGDDCLRQIGNLFKNVVVRAPDIVARYGGEEFVVILPETEENGAKDLAEKIRKAVEELAIVHSASDISKYVTVSIGVVTVNDTGNAEPDKVVTLADEALYLAKAGGRNRVEVALLQHNSLT